MRYLIPLAALALLPACQLQPPVPVSISQYVCPNGLIVQAGLTEDQRHLLLTVNGRRHTLSRAADAASYSNGYYTARPDDLFLHLTIPGVLLPQHCHLQAPEEEKAAPAGAAPAP